MGGIQIPRLDSILRWADWLEISAACSTSGTSSRGELEGALRVSGFLERRGQDGIDERCTDVFAELNQRAIAANNSYPFALTESLLHLRSAIDEYPAYLFCLALSYCRSGRTKREREFPERMFEDLSCMAAANYVDGDALRFAFPRSGRNDGLPKRFRDAIHAAAQRIGEGDGCREKPTRSAKDDALDVLAWRHFPDTQAGKLVLMGQCATGLDWQDKLNDLNPKATCDEWMSTPLISPVVKAMFIPHRVDQRDWERCNRRAGIIFDRCRLAFWAQGFQAELRDHLRWYKVAIRTEAA